jgi:hypothetical protein
MRTSIGRNGYEQHKDVRKMPASEIIIWCWAEAGCLGLAWALLWKRGRVPRKLRCNRSSVKRKK